MRKIPLKNYIIFVCLIVVTIFLTCYGCDLYNQQRQHGYTTPLIPLLTEIKEDDIDNYLLENSTAVLYISDKTDKTLEEQETELKKLLMEKNIHTYFAYFDISSNKEESLTKIQNKYQLELKDNTSPILIAFTDGEIVEVYNEETWNLTEIQAFLIRNEVIEND